MNTASKEYCIAQKTQSQILAAPLTNSQWFQSIASIKLVLASCFGLSGSLKNIHNNTGGHITVTSSSARLLQCISYSNSLVRLFGSSVQNHITNTMDQGLFCGLFCIELVDAFQQSNHHRHLVVDIFEVILADLLNYLNLDYCFCKLRLDFSNTRHIIKLVKSVISTKPGCGFSNVDINYISKIIIDTFLESAISNTTDSMASSVHYILLEGFKITDTHVVSGLLYEIPQMSSCMKKMLKHGIGKDITSSFSKQTTIKVFLLDTSMAGDNSNYLDVTYQTEDDLVFSNVTLSKIMQLMQCMVQKHKVGLFACQKVIHPKIKKYLQENQVFVMDRLGSDFIKPFKRLTGAQAYSAIDIPMDKVQFGYVSSVRHCMYGSRTFVQLEGIDNEECLDVCSVVLCNRTDEALLETKEVFQAALHTLHMSAKEPFVLFGGGCWQTHIACYLKQQGLKMSGVWAQEMGTTTSVVADICSSFSKSLTRVVQPSSSENLHLIDKSSQHNWTLPFGFDITNLHKTSKIHCVCGAVDYWKDTHLFDIVHELHDTKPEMELIAAYDANVFDCYRSCINALQVSVRTASLIIQIDNIIEEK